MKLYSTGCANCKTLERLLDQRGLNYEKCSDMEEMIRLGIQSAPVLEVDGTLLLFYQAVNLLNGFVARSEENE
jgi:glutaredoxin